MDASVEDVDGGIALKINNFLVAEGENEIRISQKFIYAFSDTVGEGNVPNRGKAVIDLITGRVLAPPSTGNDILLDSDISIDSYGKICMQYVVSDTEPDVEVGQKEEPWMLL